MDEHIRTLYEIVGKLVTQGGKHLEFQAVMVEQVAKLVEGQKELVEGQKELASGQRRITATQKKLVEDVRWLIDSHAQIVDRLEILEQGQQDLFRLYDARRTSDCLSREATPRARRYLRRVS
ncbi:MAG: hypothetical protein OXK16_09555 [bacterium]|nr:hypothetical protein [bacterium]